MSRSARILRSTLRQSLRAALALCLVWLAVCVSWPAPARAASTAALDEFANAWVEEHDVTGSWRLQRGNIVLAEGARGASDTFASPITTDTPLWIGSNSKQFAAAAVLRLVEQGKLELSAPLTHYFVELKPEAVSRGGRTCNIEHVLSHGCGLVGGSALDLATVKDHLSEPREEAALLALVNAETLQFEPGSDYSYSNLGYALIGLLVQRASGQGYEQFLQEQFWGPLNMTHTGIHPRSGLDIARGQVGGVFGWVDAARWQFLEPTGFRGVGAAGNIFSSARDLARWVDALNHGHVLSAASYSEMTRVRAKNYALGLVVSDTPLGKRIFHNGELSPYGYSSQAAYLPEHDLSVVVLSNRKEAPGRSLPFMKTLLAKATDQPLEPMKFHPTWRLRLNDSFFVGTSVPSIALALVMMLRRVRKPELLDRLSWWLSYHLYALLLVGVITAYRWSPFDPWLLGWFVLVLAGVHQSRFWRLPKWQRPRGWRPYPWLVLRSLGVVFFLVDASVAARYFPAVFAVLLLAELGSYLAQSQRFAANAAAAR